MTGRLNPAGHPSWWRHAVIYQIYIRSFADANGDGIGDLAGIESRLGYLSDLGVDAVWITPFYPSPQADGGYDVADYRAVDPVFGSLDEFDALMAAAQGRGIKVIVDLVPNHTSSAHPWFRSALAAAPGSSERARYIFRSGRGPGGAEPPNNWVSVFGGSAWTPVPSPRGQPQQWYLHLFAPEQPDLDWTNPEVRREFESILRFWLDRGVDGFRIDVAHGLVKDPAMPDLDERYPSRGPAPTGHPYWDQDEIHDVYRSWRAVLDEYGGNRMFVAEAWVASTQQLARYVRPDELHTAFNFDFLRAAWDADELRAAIDSSFESMAAVGAAPTWVLSNHDVVRHVSRYGGGEQGERRARAAVLLMLALPGGAYVYQGDELGLPEVADLPDEVLQDPTFLRTGGASRGRDGCRVPIPWSGDKPSYGFGPGAASWLPQPPQWRELSVTRQSERSASMLHLYRGALEARRRHAGFRSESLQWIDAEPGMLAFRRSERLTCLVNASELTLPVPNEVRGAEVILASIPLRDLERLPPACAVWLATAGGGADG